jgi:hypothetical protein
MKASKDYKNGKIYIIEPICEHPVEDCYYGSTTQLLCKRMDFHRGHFRAWKDGKRRKTMVYDLFDKYGIENCVIRLHKLYSCQSKEQLEAEEGQINQIKSMC